MSLEINSENPDSLWCKVLALESHSLGLNGILPFTII